MNGRKMHFTGRARDHRGTATRRASDDRCGDRADPRQEFQGVDGQDGQGQIFRIGPYRRQTYRRNVIIYMEADEMVKRVEVSWDGSRIYIESSWMYLPLTVNQTRDLIDDLYAAIGNHRTGDVTSIIREALARIHAEQYGMTVQDHAELDKVLRAMNGYLEYVAKKQEGE